VEVSAQVAAALAAVLALILSVYTLRRQNRLEQNSYLILSLSLSRASERHLIATTVLENRSVKVKHLDVVLLLLCPYDETAVEAFNAIMHDRTPGPGRAKRGDGEQPGSVRHMRDFRAALPGSSTALTTADRQLVPLEYYVVENSEVADEILTFDAVLDVSDLTPGVAYSVRLILYGPDRLHRVVHQAFVA
jgi:hypothetical protein